MKKILPLFLVLISSQFGIAQYNDVINFGIQNIGSQVKSSIIDSDGNTVVSSRIGQDLHIASFNASNILNWSTIVHSSTTSVSGDVYASNSGAYYVRTKKQVMKLDSVGGVIWSKELDNPINGLSRGCALPNGGFAVMGQITSDYLATLIVFDPNGTVSWSRKIESATNYSLPRKILITPQNNILTFCEIGGISSALFTTWDLNGNVISEKQHKFDGSGYSFSYSPSAKFTSNGHLYMTGFIGVQLTQPGTRDMVIYHFDKNLDFVNGKQYAYTYDEEGRDLVEDEDGNIIAIGLAKPQLNCSGLLKVMKLTPDLDTIYTRHYGSTGNGYAFTAINRTDSVIYATGAGSFYSYFASGDGYVIKTDKNFNLACGIFPYQTVVNDISMIATNYSVSYTAVDRTFIPYNYEMPSSIETYVSCSGPGPEPDPSASLNESMNDGFSIYPNPVNNLLEVTADQNFDLVQIYSANGELVMQHSSIGSTATLNCEQLESGVYIARIIGDGFSVNRKLIKN